MLKAHTRKEGLIREREARTSRYRDARAQRDQLASAPPDEFSSRDLAHAENLLGSALYACEFWEDPIPDAPSQAATTEITQSTTPEAPFAPLPASASGVVDTEKAIAARILASDRAPGEGRANAEVDAIARRIAAA